ncbi:MAG: HlyC/CorC family transporter [Deltaproteobacteria bacterium]|nr:HlyC/CorC family transporter [Deltaproteobacteria bacterium]MBW2595637.1 HlyC/CorC family transporter [Deltaproteobacteria bacterium]MBW2650934.1 HlyC/CorC family transporter [Deltaproteobacteria bacterium]
MPDLLFFFPVLILLCLEGMFSGGEIALVACDINLVRQKAKAGSRSASIALKLMEKPEWFLSTTLTGTNLCAVSNTAITTAMFISFFGPEMGALLSIAVMIPLILIVGEVIPKSIFQQHADLMAPRISWFIWISSWIFYPVVFFLSRISRRVVYAFSRENDLVYSSYITKNGLESLLQEEKSGGDIMKSEKEMIQRVFDFSDSTADQIMVPLSNVTSLPAKTTLKEAASVIVEKGYSYIPVYSDKVFDIIGILYSFDILEAIYREDQGALTPDEILVESCAKKTVLYVPETKPAKELFLELQKKGEQIAIIVDEYGGAVGIVTIEDILEEVVGEIEDEYHSDGAVLYRKVASGKYLFNAQAKIDTVRNLIPVDIPQGDYETLGGFILHKMGRVPARNDSFRHGPLLFVIEDADMKLIREVLVILPPGMDLRR